MLSLRPHSRGLLTGLLLIGLVTPTLMAQGQILIERPVPPPQPGPGQTRLILKTLKVQADITDGVAVTVVEQSFLNPTRQQIEGVYIFPLPDNVAVGDFAMTVDGKTLRGEVLDAATARKAYEDIVRRLRDPGLLEYLGQRLFRASIFPIPPGGTVDVKLQYSQTLEEQGGLGLLRHPLRCDPAGDAAVDQVLVTARLKSTQPLTAVFSPSHECDIRRPNDYEATVGYEAARVRPDRDFMLYYQRRDAAFGVVVLTNRAPGEPGTFLLRIAPRVELSESYVQPKDVAFVIDTSGSMAGLKLEQTKRALRFCLRSLNSQDRFNIYAFSTGVNPFREALVPVTDDIRNAADEYVGQLQAAGGTNIHAALQAALGDDPRDDSRPYLIVFMTDGQPTVEITDPEQIRRNVVSKNVRNVRFHVFGVGSDVNTHLLDKLAEATRGSRDYCTENEDLELKLSAFVARLTHPVLTDLKLRIDGVRTFDVYPSELPDLFRGNDLVVLGRYDGAGAVSIRLEGRVRGEARTIGYEAEFPQVATTNDFLPRLWANRKVAYLLDQLRLHGENRELVEEVVRLAKRYGIVTPYTAALILEDNTVVPTTPAAQAVREQARRSLGAAESGGRGLFGGGQGVAPPASGAPAVGLSRDLAKARTAVTMTTWEEEEGAVAGAAVFRHVGDKTLVLVDNRWTDVAWDGKKLPTKVPAFSEDYFKLLARHPDLKRYFALGERVLVVLGDEVYESTPPANGGTP